jgi:phage virion morphogenesis protein
MSSGIQIKIDAKDLGRAGEALQNLLRRADHAQPMLDEIGDALARSSRHRFETSTGPDGEAWAPSARAQKEGGKTLVDRGHLRDSVTHLATTSAAIVGSNLVYARVHQLGSEVMPVRPYLGIDADDEAEIGAIVQDHLSGAFDGATP